MYEFKVYAQEIDRFLSPKALVLYNTDIKRSVLEIDHQVKDDLFRRCIYCRFAIAKTPINIGDTTVADEYLARWGRFLNDLAERNIWQYGTLGKCLLIPLVNPTEGLLCSYAFTGLRNKDHNQDSVEELNKLLGFEVFQHEGVMPKSFDWFKFPW